MRDDSEDLMKVSIDRIPDEGLDLDQEVTVEWLRKALGEGSPFAPRAAGRLHLHLHLAEEVVHVRGKAKLELACPCSRCLDEVPILIDTPIEVALFPGGSEPAPGPAG